MKTQQRVFFRTVALSSVIACCAGFGLWGAARAYENTRLIGFGEYQKAVELNGGELRVFDFVWQFGNAGQADGNET